MMRSVLSLGCLLVACSPEWGGTSVGNPGKMTSTIGEPEGVSLMIAEAFVKEVVLEDCEGGTTIQAVDNLVDLVAGFNVVVLDEELCGAELVIEPLLYFYGEDDLGQIFNLYLDPQDDFLVESWSGVAIDGTQLIFEMGEPGWLNTESLALTGVDDVIMETDPRAVSLSERITEDVALFEDDGDGVVSAEEREQSKVGSAAYARGEEDESDRPHVSGEDAKCATVPLNNELWPVFFAGIFLMCRRRSRA